MVTWVVIGLTVFLLVSQLTTVIPASMGESEGKITDFDVQVESTERIRAYVEIENTGGNKQQGFYLKFSVRDENGRWWAADGIAPRDIPPGQKHQVSALIWSVPDDAIAGWYLARIELYDRAYGEMYLIDYQEIPNAFRIIRGGEISDIVIENQEYSIDSNARKSQALYLIPVFVQVRNTGNIDDVFYVIANANDPTGESYSSQVEEIYVPLDWGEDCCSVRVQIPLNSDAAEGYYSIKVELYGNSRGDDRSGLYNFLGERDLSQAFRVFKKQNSEIGNYSINTDEEGRKHFISSISVPNAQLSVIINRPDGKRETLTNVADASGKIELVLEPGLFGIWKIRISYEGDGYFSTAERSFEFEIAEDVGRSGGEVIPPEEELPLGTRVLTGQPPPTKNVHKIVFTDAGSQTTPFPNPTDSVIGIWITVTAYVEEPVLYFDFEGITYSARVIPNPNTLLDFSKEIDITNVRISIKDRGYSDDVANIAYAYPEKERCLVPVRVIRSIPSIQ